MLTDKIVRNFSTGSYQQVFEVFCFVAVTLNCPPPHIIIAPTFFLSACHWLTVWLTITYLESGQKRIPLICWSRQPKSDTNYQTLNDIFIPTKFFTKLKGPNENLYTRIFSQKSISQIFIPVESFSKRLTRENFNNDYLTPFNFRPPLIFGRGWPKIRGAEKVKLFFGWPKIKGAEIFPKSF